MLGVVKQWLQWTSSDNFIYPLLPKCQYTRVVHACLPWRIRWVCTKVYSMVLYIYTYIHVCCIPSNFWYTCYCKSLLFIDQVGSGVFGDCKRMLLSSTEVAVKTFNPSLSNNESIMYEAKAMSRVCKGSPNLLLLFRVFTYRVGLPQLVSKYYSFNNQSATLHMLLVGKLSVTLSEQQWAWILLGICNAIEAVHSHGFLHNDIKADDVVLSDVVPAYANNPSITPILINFEKSRPVAKPKIYRLTE